MLTAAKFYSPALISTWAVIKDLKKPKVRCPSRRDLKEKDLGRVKRGEVRIRKWKLVAFEPRGTSTTHGETWIITTQNSAARHKSEAEPFLGNRHLFIFMDIHFISLWHIKNPPFFASPIRASTVT